MLNAATASNEDTAESSQNHISDWGDLSMAPPDETPEQRKRRERYIHDPPQRDSQGNLPWNHRKLLTPEQVAEEVTIVYWDQDIKCS